MPITAEYDREADALYVRLRDGERHHAVEIDDSTYVDVDADERPIGIEILYPSLGLDLQPTVRRFGLEQQLAEIISAIAGCRRARPAADDDGRAAPRLDVDRDGRDRRLDRGRSYDA